MSEFGVENRVGPEVGFEDGGELAKEPFLGGEHVFPHDQIAGDGS